ncbi:MAG TPA: hypothetical protein PKN32_14740 [Bacteroidales bacterium]|nr:hypothetical protein [Bacteroidales bacterium]
MKAHFSAKLISSAHKTFKDRETGEERSIHTAMILFPDAREGVLQISIDDSIKDVPQNYLMKDCMFEVEVKQNYNIIGTGQERTFKISGLKFVITKITAQ